MEAFSLLKYWRAAGGGGGEATTDAGGYARAGATTIVTAVGQHSTETDEDDGDDDGPFFDLEFTVPDEEEGDEQEKREDSDFANCVDVGGDETGDNDNVVVSDESDGENEGEFKFALSSGSSGDRTDPNIALSPSDDLFFKGRLVPIETSSIDFNGGEPNAKSQFSLLKSATKFRVLMLKFKRSKTNAAEKAENGSASTTPKQQQKQEEPPKEKKQQNQTQSKLFTVKFKVEEVPIMSLFTRDSSSRASSANNKSQKQQSSEESAPDEKKFSKEVMQRYLKMVKPLYIRVSKRYGEKLGFSGQLSVGGTKDGPLPPSTAAETTTKGDSEQMNATAEAQPAVSSVKGLKPGNIPAGLRVVCKHLGKSRSASSAAPTPGPSIQSQRRDDSLLQQQDGIQGAILHCKRSFNSSRDSESSLLSRSVSDPSHDKSMNHQSKNCSEEPKVKETGGA
ncbi:hypothetical protein NMG60_11027030 [Bertholletia excelsa]